jgi:hypothetical protein
MLNHTYTSVKNANLVDCGKKQHISSQPSPLLKDNFLGEFRTELDKKKVLANLGIATSLSLEWEYIKGDIGRSVALMQELDSRTKYVSEIDGFQKTLIEGVKYLESVIGGEQDAETEQDERIAKLEEATSTLNTSLTDLQTYLSETIEVDLNKVKEDLETITTKVSNITELIQVSTKEGNALVLLSGEGEEFPGLYVPDLSQDVQDAQTNINDLRTDVDNILDTYVTKEELGGGDFDFVDQDDFDNYVDTTADTLSEIQEELKNTVKTGEDGHVDTLYVNTISKNNDDANIVITDSFEVNTGIPLDIRCVVENLDELKALPAKVCYAGMGVVVNSLSSLYILRNPEEGTTIDQDYISNIYNWKCPEDLVTVALTRPEYEALEEINPNVFYYIYEDEIKLTQEPKREDFLTEEEFQEAWQAWTNSLKVLAQEYMSASWGVDIENKLAQKASAQSVLILNQEIDKLKGGGEGVSLDSLNEEVTGLKEIDAVLTQRLDEILTTVEETESGRLVTVEDRVAAVTENLKSYVTKDELAELSGDFNFVKPEDYEADKEAFNAALAEKVTTKAIELNGSLVEVQEGTFQVNSEALAKVSEVPVIEILTQKEYDDLENKDEDTYYYTYDEDTIYVTQAELTQKLEAMQAQINALVQTVGALEKAIEDLQALHPQDEENI